MNRRIRDYGIVIGRGTPGPRNKITDVAGVTVGHCTVDTERNKTGVTVVMPCEDNPFSRKLTAAAWVQNGFGKSQGLIQIEELGILETPIALTNTLNVGIVHDSIVDYMLKVGERDGISITSVNPVVGECNDSQINRIGKRAVSGEQVLEAIRQAGTDFEEGDVGAGAGTICYGLKGGIGSASRVLEIDGKRYAIGVLVQSNFGATADFVLNGIPAGEKILQMLKDSRKTGKGVHKDLAKDAGKKALEGLAGNAGQIGQSDLDQGSIMTILATDLPVSDRQLKRIIRRTAVGIARTGAYTGHGSGEVMIGFTTANRVLAEPKEKLLSQTVIHESLINLAFQAAAEAAHEAILNSMVCAERTAGLDGRIYCSLAEFLPQLFIQ